MMAKVLVIGGTRFFGKHLVEKLVQQGHDVTIATRGQHDNPFDERVHHTILDRTNSSELREAFEETVYDIVYDNICYTPKEAMELCAILNDHTTRLIFTSTMSVYEADGVAKREEDFNAINYIYDLIPSQQHSYAEGKRQAEAVFEDYANFPVVAVRFPIVMGEDDYTSRLSYYVEHIEQGEAIEFVNLDAEMSFILADEAAEFLYWAGFANIEGPYNATANGKISMRKLIQTIEQVVDKEAIILEGTSPYSIPASWYMTNAKATEAGFTFTQLTDWLKPLIEKIAK